MTKKTIKGQPITDELIGSIVRDAEAGYDVEDLKRRGGRRPIGSSAARVVPVRLDPELESALKARAEAEHSNTSEVIRDALRAWLQSA